MTVLDGNGWWCWYLIPHNLSRAKKCYINCVTRWFAHNRHKYLLQYHVIFVCKYRKKLLADNEESLTAPPYLCSLPVPAKNAKTQQSIALLGS